MGKEMTTEEKNRSAKKIALWTGILVIVGVLISFYFSTNVLEKAAKRQFETYVNNVIKNADVTHGSIDVDIINGSVTINDIIATPRTEGQKASIDSVTLSNFDTKNEVPHKLSVRVRGMKPEIDPDQFKQIAGGEVDRIPRFNIDFDYRYAANAQDLYIDRFMVDMDSSGVMTIDAIIADFDIMQVEKELSNVAILPIKKANITIQDKGLISALVDATSKKTGKPEDEVRKNLVESFKFLSSTFVGADKEATAYVDSVAGFIEKSGTLSISLLPNEPTTFSEAFKDKKPLEAIRLFNPNISHRE